jgi:hypothetical protein
VRRLLSVVALVAACAALMLRVQRINRMEPVELSARSYHVLYLDSLRHELLTFAEQYGRPVFQYDTTMVVTGHGRIQLGRLREALFDPRIEYRYGDDGFSLDWRSDPKPRRPGAGAWHAFGARPAARSAFIQGWTPWPPSTIEYARLRRIAITPQWPEPPQRPSRRRPHPTPNHHDAFSSLTVSLSSP